MRFELSMWHYLIDDTFHISKKKSDFFIFCNAFGPYNQWLKNKIKMEGITTYNRICCKKNYKNMKNLDKTLINEKTVNNTCNKLYYFKKNNISVM